MDIPTSVHVLVTGATGFVGRHLIPALEHQGHQVRAGTRHPEDYRGAGTPTRIDLHDAAEAKARGVKVVYLGGLGDLHEAASRSEHLRSRHEVGCILREGCDAVELRAAIVIGAGSVSFEILRQLVDRLPVMICPRWVTTRCQPIALPDVIRYLIGALAVPAGSYEIGGAEVLTYEQMMRTYARLTGQKRLIVKVPILSPSLSSHWIGVITDQPAAVARPLADGLSVEVVVTEDRIRRLIPFEPMGFVDAVRLAITDHVPPSPPPRTAPAAR
jgi:uncharacterized protein YbjT (DUF2867 family)